MHTRGLIPLFVLILVAGLSAPAWAPWGWQRGQVFTTSMVIETQPVSLAAIRKARNPVLVGLVNFYAGKTLEAQYAVRVRGGTTNLAYQVIDAKTNRQTAAGTVAVNPASDAFVLVGTAPPQATKTVKSYAIVQLPYGWTLSLLVGRRQRPWYRGGAGIWR